SASCRTPARTRSFARRSTCTSCVRRARSSRRRTRRSRHASWWRSGRRWWPDMDTGDILALYDDLNFHGALAALIAGRRVARKSMPDGVWLILVPGSTITVVADRPLGKAAPELVGTQVTYAPHIDIYAGGVLQPWAGPTHEQLLAQDWIVLD